MKIITLIFIFLSFGCTQSDNLKSNCIDAAEILSHARRLLKESNSENVIEEDKIVSTIVTNIISDTKRYIEANYDKLNENYGNIKKAYQKDGINSYDALCAMAVINEFTFILSGKAIDDRCKYIRLMNENKGQSISQWILDDFFASLITNENHTIDNWNKLDQKSKIEVLFGTLLVPDLEGKNCLSSKE